MNVVQFVCLFIAAGLMLWSVISFVVYMVRRHREKHKNTGEPEKGE